MKNFAKLKTLTYKMMKNSILYRDISSNNCLNCTTRYIPIDMLILIFTWYECICLKYVRICNERNRVRLSFDPSW